MLYAVQVNLEMKGDTPVSATGYHALSLFLHLMEKTSPSISDELHDDTQMKPFTVALLGGKSRRGVSLGSESERVVSLRVTFLKEDIFAAFMDAMWRLPSETNLNLAGMPVKSKGLATTAEQSVLAGFSSYEDILGQTSSERNLKLSFLSPTTFRSKGRRNVLFPEPSLVFQSLINRWNAFAPDNQKLKLADGALSSVRISGYRLATQLLDFGSYQELGFQGYVNYEIDGALSEEAVKVIQALGKFAFYSGVGAKTTMGMGQAKRISNARSISN